MPILFSGNILFKLPILYAQASSLKTTFQVARYRSNTPKPLKDALKDFLDRYPHRKRLKRGMILSLWNQTVGKRIAEQTENIHFEHGNLIIHVKNPAWRQEIHMKRFSIAKKLNDKVDEKIIREIVVRS